MMFLKKMKTTDFVTLLELQNIIVGGAKGAKHEDVLEKKNLLETDL